MPEAYVHFFGDRRNTAPTWYTSDLLSFIKFMEQLEYGQRAMVMVRYYAMDCDKRWERARGGRRHTQSFLFNYLSDRISELVIVLGLPDLPMDVTVPKYLVSITTMSHYNAEFPFPVAFPPQPMTNVLAEWLSKQEAHVGGAY
ncbi:BPG-independent [Mycena olivaceomarginata]|nr:BPG-independent [Mycena olivaceomarginata]